MSTNDSAADKSRHRRGDSASTTNDAVVNDLQCGVWAGHWDARDVLAGRLDDTTVRQAVEVGR